MLIPPFEHRGGPWESFKKPENILSVSVDVFGFYWV